MTESIDLYKDELEPPKPLTSEQLVEQLDKVAESRKADPDITSVTIKEDFSCKVNFAKTRVWPTDEEGSITMEYNTIQVVSNVYSLMVGQPEHTTLEIDTEGRATFNKPSERPEVILPTPKVAKQLATKD